MLLEVLLNNQQICGSGACLHYYRHHINPRESARTLRSSERGLYTRRLACSSGGHHRHRTLRPPPATMVVVASTAYTNLRYVRSQMLAGLRPGRFPYRPTSMYLVRRPVPQRPRRDVLALLYDSSITWVV